MVVRYSTHSAGSIPRGRRICGQQGHPVTGYQGAERYATPVLEHAAGTRSEHHQLSECSIPEPILRYESDLRLHDQPRRATAAVPGIFERELRFHDRLLLVSRASDTSGTPVLAGI